MLEEKDFIVIYSELRKWRNFLNVRWRTPRRQERFLFIIVKNICLELFIKYFYFEYKKCLVISLV